MTDVASCGCLAAKFGSCNSLLSSVHTLLENILRCVRVYIKRKHRRRRHRHRHYFFSSVGCFPFYLLTYVLICFFLSSTLYLSVHLLSSSHPFSSPLPFLFHPIWNFLGLYWSYLILI